MKKKNVCTCLILIVFLTMFGCNLKDTGDSDSSTHRTLISFELVTQIPISDQVVDQFLDFIGLLGIDPTIIQDIQQFTGYPVNVYKVTYLTFFRKKLVTASGAVIIPEMQGPLQVVSFQLPTVFGNSEVPSQFKGMLGMGNMLDLEVMFASCGYVCAVADYLGYGSSREIFHPYHQASIGQTSVDMLRATVELCSQLNLDINNEYLLCGYSEGGYSTLALQKEIQLRHEEEFPIAASSAGAGAYDLLATMQYYLNSNIMVQPAVTCFFFLAYRQMYDCYPDLGEIFKSPYKERIESGLFSGDIPHEEILPQLTFFVAELFTDTFIAEFTGDRETTLKTAFEVNNLYTGWAPTAPTRLYNGTADMVVPPFNAETALTHFRSNGSSTVEYIPLEGEGHGLGYFTWFRDTLAWFSTL